MTIPLVGRETGFASADGKSIQWGFSIDLHGKENGVRWRSGRR
jgi:hypothetical protein